MNIIERHKKQIEHLCHSNNVKTLYAFGSVLSNDFKENSDIDLLVDFKDIAVEDYADTYFNLKFALIELLGREIDLLEIRALKNPYLLDEINRHKTLIYGKAH